MLRAWLFWSTGSLNFMLESPVVFMVKIFRIPASIKFIVYIKSYLPL
jgi:hypothetical protein